MNKIKYSSSLAVAGLFLLVIGFATTVMGAEKIKGPAGQSSTALLGAEAISLEGMNLSKYKSLPDATKIKIGNNITTKGELNAAFRREQQAELAKDESSRVQALVEKRVTALRQAHKARIDAQNAGIKAELDSTRGNLQPDMKYINPPEIAEVKGTAMNDGYLMIKGKNFGKEPGRALLKLRGNIPGGQLELIPDSYWSNDHLAVKVSLPNGGVPAQNDAMLQIIRKDGATSNWYGKVIFEPELDSSAVSYYGQVTCSDSGWSNLCYNDSSFHFTHFAAPDGTTYSGTDSYTLELRNGWKTVALNNNAVGGSQGSSFACDGWQAGVQQIKLLCNWTIPTPKLSPIPEGAIYKYKTIMGRFITIEGPKGLPWK